MGGLSHIILPVPIRVTCYSVGAISCCCVGDFGVGVGGALFLRCCAFCTVHDGPLPGAPCPTEQSSRKLLGTCVRRPDFVILTSGMGTNSVVFGGRVCIGAVFPFLRGWTLLLHVMNLAS